MKLAFGFKISSFLIIGFRRSFLVFPSVVSQVCNLKSNKLEFRYRIIWSSFLRRCWSQSHRNGTIATLYAVFFRYAPRRAKPFGVTNSTAEFHSDLEFLADIQKAYREFFYLFFLLSFMTLNRWIYMYDERTCVPLPLFSIFPFAVF